MTNAELWEQQFHHETLTIDQTKLFLPLLLANAGNSFHEYHHNRQLLFKQFKSIIKYLCVQMVLFHLCSHPLRFLSYRHRQRTVVLASNLRAQSLQNSLNII